MGILSRFKKSEPAQPPKSGAIEKEPSYVMLIPKDDSLLDNPKSLVKKLTAMSGIKVVSTTENDNGSYKIALEYNEESFDFFVSVEDFSLPELFRIGHDFTDEEIGVMESAKRGLSSKMVFGENNCSSFHLQIKLLCAMISEPAGIVDSSSERMLAGRWAKLAAQSEVAPSPEYLYVMQCVSGENNEVWIHTHGLNRCGSVELEILQSDSEHYSSQTGIINTLAMRAISNNGLEDEFEPIYLMQLSEEISLVAAWTDWEKAIKMYPQNLLGGISDRQEWHNVNTGVVYLYKNKQDADNRKLSHVSIYNELYGENSIQMITTEETERMRRLALERLDYMTALWNGRENFEKLAIIIKVGLEVDEEYRDGDMKEHIWFELKALNEPDGSFTAELTQEPYYVKALKAGDIRKCRFDEITDWIVFISDDRITPDSVYRLGQNRTISG